MNPELVSRILTSESKEIADLKANLSTLEDFIDLARKIDDLPHIGKRFYEESRSLYQATAQGRDMATLEGILSDFFGPPVKAAGKPMPRKLRKNVTVNYLGGIQKDQSLFLLKLKSGEFYGALWPWRRNKEKIEIHLGFCSEWITDDDYGQLESFVKAALTKSAMATMDAGVGGQIHGISLPSFLQMSEMEGSTVTLTISSGTNEGRLYLIEGSLVNAAVGDQTGREAAYRIISWEDVTIGIGPPDESQADEIKQPLMHVLMESLKIKDEHAAAAPAVTRKEKKAARARARKAARAAKKAGLPPPPSKRLVRLEKAPAPKFIKPKTKPSTLFMVIAAALLVAGAMVVLTLYVLNQRAEHDGYRELIKQVDSAPSPERQIELLEAFLDQHWRTPRQGDIDNRIRAARQAIEDREYEKATLAVSSLPVDEHYEKKAIAEYSKFLDKYPDSRYASKINQSIGEIKKLLDQYYFEELKRAARLDFGKRLETYQQYLTKFPKGRYKQDVQLLISQMGREYLEYLKQEAVDCDKQQKWASCINRIEGFINIYDGDALASEAIRLRQQLVDQRDLAALRKQAAAISADPYRARQLYASYLDEHPQTTLRRTIETEMSRLDRQLGAQTRWKTLNAYATDASKDIFERIQRVEQFMAQNPSGVYARRAHSLLEKLEAERQLLVRQQKVAAAQRKAAEQQQRQQQDRVARQKRVGAMERQLKTQLAASPRFTVHAGGTVTDRTTGLTWTLIDSYQELGGCINFDTARSYVAAMQHGGYRDWRLPTAGELATIYKKKPFFPSSGASWYWSSEAYVRGYHSVANIVTAKPETVFESTYKDQDQCGAVRAVRP